MGTLIWLVFTTVVGGLIGKYVPAESQAFIGAVIGFVVGLVLRLIVAGGGEGLDDLADGIGDMID